MHSPHPYFAAVGTYRRWFGVLILLLFLGWIASFTIPHNIPEDRFASGAILLSFPPLLLYGWFLGILAVILVAHLKEMLGSAVSPVTPGLVRAQFFITGLVLAVFTIVVPLATYWGLGYRGSATTIVAIALVAWSVAALATFRWPWTAFFVFYSPAATVIIDKYFGRNAPWIPSTAATILLLIVAAGCLTILALRLAKFHEEMPEYARRIPTSWRAVTHSTGQTSGVGGASFPVMLPRNLRAYHREGGVTEETLLQRARHWHAAWRTVWSAAVMGTIFMTVMYGMWWLMNGQIGFNKGFGNPMCMVFSVMPAMIFGHPRNRQHLLQEWMRPYSRTQYVQAVGVTLAVSCALCWLLINLAPPLIHWLVTSENPLNATLQNPFNVMFRQQILLSLCMMPILFSAASWPHKHVGTLVAAVVGISVISTLPLFVNDRLVEISEFNFRLLLGGLVAIGLFMTWLSYRRWLNCELET